MSDTHLSMNYHRVTAIRIEPDEQESWTKVCIDNEAGAIFEIAAHHSDAGVDIKIGEHVTAAKQPATSVHIAKKPSAM